MVKGYNNNEDPCTQESKKMEETMKECRIETDADVLAGKPVIKGTRISVEFILELLSQGCSYEDILKNYPQLTRDDILAVVEYALKNI